MDNGGNQVDSVTVHSGKYLLTANISLTAVLSEWIWLPIAWTWWQVIQFVLSIIGIVGNLLVIAVIIRRGRTQFSSDVLIAGLAFADLSTSVWMIPRPTPYSLPPNWVGRMYCRVVYSNVCMWISVVASVFTLTAISVERVLAVKFPFRFKSWFDVRQSLMVVGFTWFLATVINIFTLAIYDHDEISNKCQTIVLTKELNMVAGVFLFTFKYLLPIIIMIVSQVIIIREIRALTRSLQIDNGTVPPYAIKLLQTMKTMTRTVLSVVVVFIICWTPDQVCFLLFNLDLYPTYMHSTLYHVLVCLAFINSCCNPFIYSAKNKKFREAVFNLLCTLSARKCCRRTVNAGNGQLTLSQSKINQVTTIENVIALKDIAVDLI